MVRQKEEELIPAIQVKSYTSPRFFPLSMVADDLLVKY
jgi:hypothetical protein